MLNLTDQLYRDSIDFSENRTSLESPINESPESELLLPLFPMSISSHPREFYATSSKEDVAKSLGTDLVRGLSSTEAANRLAKFGPNEMKGAEPTPLWQLVLDQFKDLIVLLLCGAALISLILGEYVEGIAIVLIVLLNAIMGVVQEAKAGAALEALKKMTTTKSFVIRDGEKIEVKSPELVVGDIVVLETGNSVPADIRLFSCQGLQAKEMALTGEPEPTKKIAEYVPEVTSKASNGEEKEGKLLPSNMVFMGCDVTDGRATGIVCKTGMNTGMGEITELIETADEKQSPLQERLENLGHQLGIGAIVVCFIVFLFGLYYGKLGDEEGGKHDDKPLWLQMLLTSVSLAVAAVPEGLPAAVTITLALGMRDMVKRNALIRNLHSVETLGCTNVICTDKTGTLTRGEMTAVRLYSGGRAYHITGDGFEPKGHIVPFDVNPRNTSEVQAASVTLRSNAENFASVQTPLLLSLLCSNADIRLNPENGRYQALGNSSECPLVVAAAKTDLTRSGVNEIYERIQENPFNSERKMMSTLSKVNKPDKLSQSVFGKATYVAVVKGAPNIILDNCNQIQNGPSKIGVFSKQQKDEILKTVDDYSASALRVLAIAYKPYSNLPRDVSAGSLENELVFAGLVASIDPERPEVPPSIAQAHEAGIRVVMITGDYLLTARAIAENIGLLPKNSAPEKALDCATIRKIGDDLKRLEGSTDQTIVAKRRSLELQLDHITFNCDVYARAKPEDKITIVRSLQRQGNVCSMTGDGVNDAPALKQADIGVAMGITGTDVAKAASAMVLIDDNFVSIVGAIEQGRIIYSNIQKFVFFLVSCNIAEILIIFFCIISGLASPMDPIQLLWMNLVTDGAPALALAMEPGSSSILKEAPRSKSEPIMDGMMFVGTIVQSFVTTIAVLSAYIIGLELHSPGNWLTRDENKLIAARTMAFVTMSLAELLRSYTVRHARYSVFSLGVFSNDAMQWAVGVSAGLVIFVVTVPGVQDIFDCCDLSAFEWGIVLSLTLVPAIVEEITKLIYRITGFGVRMPKVYVPDDGDSDNKKD